MRFLLTALIAPFVVVSALTEAQKRMTSMLENVGAQTGWSIEPLSRGFVDFMTASDSHTKRLAYLHITEENAEFVEQFIADAPGNIVKKWSIGNDTLIVGLDMYVIVSADETSAYCLSLFLDLRGT